MIAACVALVVWLPACEKKPQMQQPSTNVGETTAPDVPEAYGPGETPAQPFPQEPDFRAPSPGSQEPQPAPQPIDVIPPEVQKTYHVMKPGDTLYSLAQQYYGDGKRWREIAEANNIQDPSDIAVGTRLVIPE